MITNGNENNKDNEMKKLFTGRTARQELIEMASYKLILGRCDTPHSACESVACDYDSRDNTLGGAVTKYYETCSDNALKQVFREIEKKVAI